jgi:hypothetical protein
MNQFPGTANHFRSVRLFFALLTLTGVCASSVMAQSDELELTSPMGTAVNFLAGGQFDITPSSGSFQVAGSSLGNEANGLLASITGTWTIGTITTLVPGQFYTAPVTGSGTMSIDDGSGHSLTGNLTWVEIAQSGPANVLDVGKTVNLTDLSYAGSNPVLRTLAGQGSVIDELAFTFQGVGIPLPSLEAGGESATLLVASNLSAPISAVPEPGTMALGVVGGAMFIFRKRK